MSLLIPKKWLHFCCQWGPNFLFIRTSGNPIDAKELEQFITGDIVQENAEITKIPRF